ncbi:hypothetical protein [Anatilimnocola floriformis]|uniref:hypothetical protein n=1 Tax=Anatilimnocola floriformis TaxID=2948575 RepID=UPI0020C2ECC4|nr:hypothetical protein [Anatilimnocola floriformis]
MIFRAGSIALLILTIGSLAYGQGRTKPAPPPSRYGYTLKIDAKSLPKGVTIREVRDEKTTRLFIANSSDVPLVIHERYQGDTLATGTKLVSGQVYQYFPSGVPMEGKTHLKGWQAPFGEIKETLLYLDKEPAKIYEGREPGHSKELPAPEKVAIPAKLDDNSYEIKGVVEYHLNDEYDAFHQPKK